MPVEIMLLPRWFPFHLTKISYWARTVMVPLLVLQALKPRARNPRGVTHRRAVPRAAATHRPAARRRRIRSGRWFAFFRGVDIVLRALEPFCRSDCASAPSTRRSRSSTERLNGEDGLGAIFPAMANSRDDVRRARLSRGPSASRDRARLGREAARHQGRRGLLPALRLAGVGHRARRARAARSRRRATRWRASTRARMARSRCKCST